MPQITYEQVLSQVKALPLDDKARLREYLDAQIEKDKSIEAARKQAVACSMRNLSAEYQWIEAHREKYAGQWVALKGDQLISYGPFGIEVMKAARNAGHPDAFFKLILPAADLEHTVF